MSTDLRALLPATDWVDEALARVRADPTAIRLLFPVVGRNCGRGPLPDESGWTVDDAVRVLLLEALPYQGQRLADELTALYRSGDAAERRGVLRGLAELRPRLGDLALPLVRDAVATNDSRLISAALGEYAALHLDADGYRQAVLKCVFTGIPLADVAGLADRADDELARMLADFAHERTAAGRDVPVDVWPILERHPSSRQD